MGYNTRRKSLSLTELGITLPKRARTQSHPSPPSTIVEGDESERPSKKSRLMSPPDIVREDKTKQHAAQLSPPPSPVAEGRHKVSLEGINDDIVAGTIQQLEQTGNRPHLVKELATVLATNLHSVDKSANPSALISSRLTAYLNRPWPSMSPCPLAKDLSPVHPRRLYFFLTTLPRQPIPDTLPDPKPAHRIISPSLSSASAADEEELRRYDRTRVSLSPEVDLSSPELEDGAPQEPPTPGAPFSGRNSVAPRERSASATQLERGRRGGSPQLECEERDFKQTATALFERAQMVMRRRSTLLLQQQQQLQQTEQEQDGVVKKEGGEMDVESDTHVSAVGGAGEQVDEKMGVAVSIEALPPNDDEEETVEIRSPSEEEDASALFPLAGGLRMLGGGEEHEGLGLGLGLYGSSPLLAPQRPSDIDVVGAAGTLGRVGGHGEGRAGALEQGVEVMHLDLDFPHPVGAGSGAGAGGIADVGVLGEWEDGLQSPENVELAELEDLFDAY